MQSKPHYPVLSAVPVLSRNNVQKRFCSINKSSSTPCWPFSLSVLCQVCFWAVGEFQEKAMIDTVLRHPRASGELTSGCPPPTKWTWDKMVSPRRAVKTDGWNPGHGELEKAKQGQIEFLYFTCKDGGISIGRFCYLEPIVMRKLSLMLINICHFFHCKSRVKYMQCPLRRGNDT